MHEFHSTTATDNWEHALISGNGRQGVLFYGGPAALRVTVSHERLFLPVDEPMPAPGTAAILPELRAALLAGRYQEAADAVVAYAAGEDARFARTREIDPLVGAATLTITGLPEALPGTYQRDTDFGTGIVSQQWTGVNGYRIMAELFVSRSDDVVVLRIRGANPILRLDPIDDEPPVPIDVTVDDLVLTARFPTAWDGAITGYTTTCTVRGGGTETLILIRTQVAGPSEPHEIDVVVDASTTAMVGTGPATGMVTAGWEPLLRRHIPLHRPLVDGCRLDLRAERDARARSSEALLAIPDQPALVETLFMAGRYAIASSTGELPPTLQGVWSGTYHPAWRSGYTLDGNLFTAVAAALPTGSPELLLPVFDLLEHHLDDFRDNARRLYGCDGILLPPHLSTHGRHNHFGPAWCLTFWTAGAAWAALLFHDYWRYTGDERFRRERALPFLREAAAFAADFLTDGGVLVPSYSPENAPTGTGSQAAVNATMDVTLLRALAKALTDMGDEAPDWAERLPGYRIDPDGTLAEWLWDGLAANHAHRHASHLIGLWYEPDPAIVDDPDLRAATRATIEARLAWWRQDSGAGEMAFGLVHLGLAAAALGLGEICHEIITWLADSYWRSNLVSTHNARAIFNVDICGGLPALIAAMLLASAPGHIRLLPALPAAWPSGVIVGLAARGQVRVERLAWTPDAATVVLRSPHAQRLIVNGAREVNLPAGKAVTITVERNG